MMNAADGYTITSLIRVMIFSTNAFVEPTFYRVQREILTRSNDEVMQYGYENTFTKNSFSENELKFLHNYQEVSWGTQVYIICVLLDALLRA